MNFIKNPVTICRKIFEYIHEMTVFIQAQLLKDGSGEREIQIISEEKHIELCYFFRYTLSY